MKITQPAATNFSGYENRTSGVQSTGSFKIGQILDATVLASSSNGQVSLRLGKSVLTASTNIALEQNAQLSLRVTQLQPQLLLQVIPAAGISPLQEAMKNLLPKQSSLAPLLAELAHKTLTKESPSNQSVVRNAGNLLIAAIAGRDDIKQAEGLKRAIIQSGLFFEAKLAHSALTGSLGLSTDLKSLLLRYLKVLTKSHSEAPSTDATALQSALKQQTGELPPPLKGRLPINHPRVAYNAPSPGQSLDLDSSALLQKVQGALARLGLLQVATVENLDDGLTQWQLEIPVRQGNTVETVSLTIEKEQRKTAEEASDKATWAVNLSLDLPQLGVLQSRISMDKLGLSTTFWSESENTLSVIENRLSELRANFEQQGLETHKLSCRAGQQTAATAPQSGGPLIDYQI